MKISNKLNYPQSVVIAAEKSIHPIPKFSGYFINKDGQVWSSKSNKFLKPIKNTKGYATVWLGNKDGWKNYSVHRLMLETFISLRPKGLECRHLDGNKYNNVLGNLCWGTPQENRQDDVLHNVHRISHSKFVPTDIKNIRIMYECGLFNQTEIAKLYDVVPHTISRIINKKRWGWV